MEGLLWEGLMGSAQLHYIALWANTQKSGNVGVSNFSLPNSKLSWLYILPLNYIMDSLILEHGKLGMANKIFAAREILIHMQ